MSLFCKTGVGPNRLCNSINFSGQTQATKFFFEMYKVRFTRGLKNKSLKLFIPDAGSFSSLWQRISSLFNPWKFSNNFQLSNSASLVLVSSPSFSWTSYHDDGINLHDCRDFNGKICCSSLSTELWTGKLDRFIQKLFLEALPKELPQELHGIEWPFNPPNNNQKFFFFFLKVGGM